MANDSNNVPSCTETATKCYGQKLRPYLWSYVITPVYSLVFVLRIYKGGKDEEALFHDSRLLRTQSDSPCSSSSNVSQKHCASRSSRLQSELMALMITVGILQRERSWNFEDRGLKLEDRSAKPRSPKKITRLDGIVDFVQRKIKCVKKVPAIKWDQDMLTTMTYWQIHIKSGETQMFVDDSKSKMLLRMYNPMQVVNLSRGDQRRLIETPCTTHRFWNTEVRRYRNILGFCLSKRIHANSSRLLFNG